MAEPRKVFRIEETAVARLKPSVDAAHGGLRHAEIMEELRALRAALAACALTSPREGTDGETSRLSSELNLIAGAIRGGDGGSATGAASQPADTPSKARVAHELNAVVEGTERATQKILAAAEEIDAAANNLSAALNGRIEQSMAQDIQDLVIKIFEACNFQDLIGQRVAKVLATLNFVEDHIGRVLEEMRTASASRRRNGVAALHGPRLDGDPGHASQDDVDAMFISRR